MRLHYGHPQVAIGVVFAAIVLVFAVGFTVIARQAGSDVGFDRVHATGYWLREKRWLAFLVVVGVLVVGISFLELPYASGGDTGRTVVTVTGGQFFWSLAPNHVQSRHAACAST